jgi:poly(3-hydroxybutyrate) depolymerase
MLSSYPELFAGGAIIAGLPHGSADNVQQALQAMRDPGPINAKQLGDRVRKASRHEESWPRISICYGSADQTVSSKNSDAILAQWLSVHELKPASAASEKIGSHHCRLWKNGSGRTLVDDYRIANMGHGTPIATSGPEACGSAMPHMLDAGISSTWRSHLGSAWRRSNGSRVPYL